MTLLMYNLPSCRNSYARHSEQEEPVLEDWRWSELHICHQREREHAHLCRTCAGLRTRARALHRCGTRQWHASLNSDKSVSYAQHQMRQLHRYFYETCY